MNHEPRFTSADLAYINADYRTLAELCEHRHETPGQVRAIPSLEHLGDSALTAATSARD